MKDWKVVVPTMVIGASGFGLGFFSRAIEPVNPEPLCLEEHHQEIAIVELKEVEGDLLNISTNGPVRIIWNDSFTTGDGNHEVPLGQLPSEHDKSFREFAYTGNTGTYKFYPSNTYAARGTHPSKRRFFATQTEAKTAGFIASKLVK